MQIHEEDGEAEHCGETGRKMVAKDVESKPFGKLEVESKKGTDLFTSTVETVASTPAERVEGVGHTATSMLKKSDNSLWIKGISPNTKAADLKVSF